MTNTPNPWQFLLFTQNMFESVLLLTIHALLFPLLLATPNTCLTSFVLWHCFALTVDKNEKHTFLPQFLVNLIDFRGRLKRKLITFCLNLTSLTTETCISAESAVMKVFSAIRRTLHCFLNGIFIFFIHFWRLFWVLLMTKLVEWFYIDSFLMKLNWFHVFTPTDFSWWLIFRKEKSPISFECFCGHTQISQIWKWWESAYGNESQRRNNPKAAKRSQVCWKSIHWQHYRC